MAKIVFNNKNYNIDESALAPAMAALEAHLRSMAGGADPDGPDVPAHSEGLHYTLKDDGTYEVDSMWDCTDLHVVIPSEVDGITVTSIGEYAFYYCDSMTGLTIPNSVTTIRAGAFKNCTSLTSVTLPNNLVTIEAEVFNSCPSLTSITIPNGVTTIGSYAFKGCSGLTSIVIPENVITIGDNAFSGCAGLTSIAFNGTTEQWNTIDKVSNWNWNVPAAYVQCSDGQVAL